jgi:hypothetical protein
VPDATYAGFHFSDADLVRIISGTNSAIADLNRLNSQVQAHESALITANQSTSGQVMRQRLAIWTDDFNRVIGDLNELNGRVESLRQANLRTAEHAHGEAGSGQ